MPNMTTRQAELRLSAIQNKNRTVRAALLGLPVSVTPLPENAFMLSGVPKSGNESQFRVLADNGLDITLNQDGTAYDAVATWDTMLLRLVMEGIVVLHA